MRRDKRRSWFWIEVGVLTVGILLGGIVLSHGQGQPPVVPPPPPPASIPDWVAKYAGLQEQAARACQLQLAQEQTKLDTLTKELADAKAAAAKVTPEKK
jgi:hypothetical protein